MRNLSPRFVVSALLCASLTLAPLGLAQAPSGAISAEAKEHFRAGVDLLKDPDGARYQEAYLQFKLAYDKSKSWKVLGNLALSAMKLERDGEAVEYYELYLKGGGKEIDAAEREQVERDVRVLKSGAARLTLKADVTADVSLSDSRQRPSGAFTNTYMLKGGALSVGVKAGHHTFKATANGKSVEWVVDLAPGQQLEHTFVFTDKPVAAPVPPSSATGAPPPPSSAAPVPTTASTDAPPPSGSGMKTAGYVAAGVGGAMILGGVITGLMSKSKESSVKDKCRGSVCPESARSDYDSAKSLATITNVLLIGGVVAAGAGGTLIVLGGKKESAHAPPRLAITPAGAGLVAHGSFLSPSRSLDQRYRRQLMRASRTLFSAGIMAALSWAVGCGVDGSLTFVPDDAFQASGQAGAGGGVAGMAGLGGASSGQGGQQAGSAGQAGAGAGGKAMFEPKCAACLTGQCSALFNQCATENACVECVLEPNPGCSAVPTALALHACACGNCEKQCGMLKCQGGPGGMGGTGGTGPGGQAGAPGGTGGTGPGGQAGAPGGKGGAAPGGAGGAPSTCGNGVLEGTEECDGALPPSQKTCAEYMGDPASHGKIGCTQACTVDSSDCHSCGDGTANSDEECDGNDLRKTTCEALQAPPGTLLCTQQCKFDTSKCNGVAPACGDGVLQPDNEDCDGSNLGGETCATVLGAAYGGNLGCNACRFDTGQCNRLQGLRHGPPMVKVPLADGPGAFWVDSTEVTRAQYGYFLNHVPSGMNLPPFCNFQGTSVGDLKPDGACLPTAAVDASGPGARNRTPMMCIDFCDALAYCQWSGKRLCGSTQEAPPNAPWDKLDDWHINAWTSACTANGATDYPYSGPYQSGICNDDGIGAQEVGTRAGCHSATPGYDQLRDMSGNVAEWSDACMGGGGASDTCAVRGGAFASTSADLRCAAQDLRQRSGTFGDVGFRCCELTGNPPPP